VPERELFEYKDGGIIGLDWICFKDSSGREQVKIANSSKPILIIFPGLMGDHTKPYMISLIKEGVKNGFDCVVPNLRGLAGVPLKTPKLNHGASTDDYKEVSEYIFHKYCSGNTKRKLFGVGVSLGAGILSNYMAMDGEECILEAGVGISCHFDAHRAMEYLGSNLFGVYDYILGIGIRLAGRSVAIQLDEFYAKMDPDKQIMEEFNRVWTLSEEFSILMAKCCGYPNKKVYYDDCMVTPRLKDVKKPMFFLSSKDDQFFGPSVIPFGQKHSSILLGVTEYGGHCMYFEGSILPTRQWFTEPTFEFLTYFSRKSA